MTTILPTSHENPLMEPIGPYVSIAEWPMRLAYDPLAGINVSQLSEEHRDLLLDSIDKRFEPTQQSIRVASSMQRMLRSNYTRRNPVLATPRIQRAEMLGFRGQALYDAQWRPNFADAMIVMGCTGLGKSTSMERFCSQIQQKYVHGQSDLAGWIQHVQVTYLIVPMPIHRGGLLHGILSALDAVLGTELREKYKNWTIEKLAIEVGVLLVSYSVGLLIIEELQPRNFGASPYREEMLLMLLRFLNFGIPIVFVGNPLAFSGIADHSQDLRRLTAQEPVEFMPYADGDEDWDEGLAPNMWRHNCMPQRSPFTAGVNQELRACSGGITDFLKKATKESQRLGIGAGANQVTEAHLKKYRAESRAFAMCRDLIEGFEQRDPLRLSRYLDVPWEEYGVRWGKLTSSDIVNMGASTATAATAEISADDAVAYRAAHARMRAQFTSSQTRAVTKEQKNTRARSKSSTKDLRSDASAVLAQGMQLMRAQIDAEKSDQTKRGKAISVGTDG